MCVIHGDRNDLNQGVGKRGIEICSPARCP
jgi:hypothetical protein